MKGLLLLQGGRETVVPDTPGTRKFWQEYNTNIAKSSIAHKKYVTILDADAASVEKYLAPKQRPKTKANPIAEYQQQIAQQQNEISELKTMMLRLLNTQNVAASIPAPPVQTEIKSTAAEQEFANFD